jgi:hypothetical protein
MKGVRQDTEMICTQTRFPKKLWLAVKHFGVDLGVSGNAALIRLVEEALEAHHISPHEL